MRRCCIQPSLVNISTAVVSNLFVPKHNHTLTLSPFWFRDVIGHVTVATVMSDFTDGQTSVINNLSNAVP